MDAHNFEPKPGWNSFTDNIVEDFYKPALKHCNRYDRLAGYFNSNAFAVALREMLDFIERGGKIRLGTGIELSPADIDVIEKSVEGALVQKTAEMLEDDLGRKCLAVLAQMLSTEIDGTQQLEIKIFVPKSGGIFHPKTGIFTMPNGDVVSFSGSVNETGAGWMRNVEEFKAFCSWSDEKFVNHDKTMFHEFWNNKHPILHTYDLPTAVRENIFKAKVGSEEEYRRLLDELKRLMYHNGDHGSVGKPPVFDLYGYQKDAVKAWALRGYRGILEMPTAVGKTFTAFGCMNRLQRDRNRLFTVVAVPYNHLAQQWIDNINRWNDMAPTDMKISSNILNVAKYGKWDLRLRRAVNDFNRTNLRGKHIINDYTVCVTYNTLAKPKFIDTVSKINGEMLLVADESHNAGSTVRRNGLIDKYSARLALTATPERYFDAEGSDIIRSYFNGVAYFMSIGDAIALKCLAPYDYHPVFAELSADETKKYRNLTRQIARQKSGYKGKNEQSNDYNHGPENIRARLVAKAEQKYVKLAEILKIHKNDMEHALIYCQDGKQLGKVGTMLADENIFYDKITKASKMKERRDSIHSLAEKKHDCIVAMRCLDEGVDMPSARLGIIMASTGNSLQYIQRRGRLLRRFDGKDHATIYDILVAAPPEEDEHPFAKKLVAKELLRHKEFAEYARNREEALNAIRPVAARLGINLDKLDKDYILDL